MTDPRTRTALASSGAISARRIDHIGVVVRDMEAAVEHFTERYGLVLDGDWTEPNGRLRLVYLAAGDTTLQLVTPLREGPLTDFLDDRGEGIHHVCLEVADLEAAIGSIDGEVESDPYLGGRGARVCFLTDRSHGVLVELTEPTPSGPPHR